MTLGNWRVVALSLPAVLISAIYPFMKRYISIPQAVLGVAFSWGIPMAYAAVGAQIPWLEVVLLMIANTTWTIAYDTWYAMVDKDDDLRIGVRSSAILFGRHDRLIIAMLQGTALLLMIQLGLWHDFGAAYFGGIAIAAWLTAWQQWHTRDRDRKACFDAFLNNHYFGAAIFIGLALDRLLA